MNASFSRDSLEAAAQRVGEIFVDYYDGLEQRRVDPQVDHDALRTQLQGTLGDEGVGLAEALSEFERTILPNSMATPHPRYAGLVNSSPLPAGVLGDLLVSLLNNNGGARHQSPAITAAEDEVLRAFGALFGLEPCSGMLLPGGTFANLQGLLLARAAAFPDWRRRGPRSAEGRPLIYTSAVSHFCVKRAAQVIGLGEDDVVALPITGRGALDTGALAARIARDRAEGSSPFAVVATLGTTGTGAIDPLEPIAELCAEHQLWLHVDACYGGGAALIEDLRPALAGLERADSIAVDPHKWFFIPIAAGLLLTRHPEIERAAFAIDASYIPNSLETDPFARGVPTSRRSSGLTVWMALRAHGFGTVRDAAVRNIAQCRQLEGLLAERGFVVLPDGQLSIACVRFEPPGQSQDELDAMQDEIARRGVGSGQAWFATVRHADRTWLRFNLVNVHTREQHVHELADLVAGIAGGLVAP